MSDRPCCSPSGERDRPPAARKPPPRHAPEGIGLLAEDLVELQGGVFTMGTNRTYGYPADGEGPAHEVELSPFSIGRRAVTNGQFAEFVAATGHRTEAEEFGWSFVFAGVVPANFPDTAAVAAAPWWRQVEGSDWAHPEGPHSSWKDRAEHPVIHVSWNDARAFCAWTGTRLPTEAEWEYAARGGLAGARFPWGEELEPGGEHRMNVFQGSFPGGNTGADGYDGTAPTGRFPANGFGLHEMTGNVWEWTADRFDPGYYRRSPRLNPAGPERGAMRVMRGGSYLCHASYCNRYRVDSRSASGPDSSTGNLGFRAARDA